MEKINWSDFEKIEIRTGTIRSATEFPEARKPAYKLTIDFGEFGLLQSSAQITNLYTPSDLIGKQVVAVINFPPKQIAHVISQCLVLGAVQPDGSVVLLQTERPAPDGARIA